MTGFQLPDTLRQHRPLLLACEAIGWLHMTGKAKIDFLRHHGGQKDSYDDKKWYEQETPPFPWDNLLQWVKDRFSLGNHCWPHKLTDFIAKHADRDKGLLGLLQAGHAMASGIEKQSFPQTTVAYLAQDVTHMWLSTAFGHPVRNLLADPPELLIEGGWKNLLARVEKLLADLKTLGGSGSGNDLDGWWRWRENAIEIEPIGWLRKAFTSTLAESRLPNNEVTLFDQSYVAAALFKSAVAGAILEGPDFPWRSKALKQQTRWRLLTVGIGSDHYEARAVKIGDWTGARLALDEFFTRVCKLVEVDLAIGSLLYADGEACVFSFPGERFDHGKQGYQGANLQIADWQSWLTEQIDGYACDASLEMPPYCSISEPSRSLVGMTAEIRKARETMAVPLHRNWRIPGQDSSDGHVCPVCLVRRNRSRTDKQRPCEPCKKRRTHRLDMWLEGKFESDSIWISEVADANDRVALVTMSLDIEPWLDGTRLDALRTQAIREWRRFNPILQDQPNPIDPARPFDTLINHVTTFANCPKALASGKRQGKLDDVVLASLNEGFPREDNLEIFYGKIVEDRIEVAENHPDAPDWANLNENGRARWLTHQLFRKLASPGRVYRFQRQAEDFFKALLAEFRAIAETEQNRWRTRRLVIKPDNGPPGLWKDRQSYNGRYGDAPVSLLYRNQTSDFLTICNLARLLKAEQDKDCLCEITRQIPLELKADDSVDVKQLKVESAADAPGHLSVYHPVIPLELSPVRFRVLLPCEAVSVCVDRAIEAWNDQFARVWDRLPVRIGVVAFPRMTPFQAVIEAARNIEDDFAKPKNKDYETWQVTGCETREGVTALSLKSVDGQQQMLRTMPVRLPDGREDVFYPYVAVEDGQVRFPLDFQHPYGQTYRHAKDLRRGDGILVYPSFISTVFMDGSAKRFERLSWRSLLEWPKMRDLWRLLDRYVPSQTALRSAWSEIADRREAWQGLDGTWLEDGKKAWLDLARAVFHERLGVRGACLETLVEAAGDGLLEWSLEWHMSVLKKQVAGGDR
ncbi:MAG: CRISPR-associated protein Csx11 [Thermodesulfobacteriota bacterium]